MADEFYGFDERSEVGKKGAQIIESVFAQWWNFRKANRAEDLAGVDSYWSLKKCASCQLKVQYKADEKMHRTNNFAIELVSQDSVGKAGWAFHPVADLLAYVDVVDPRIWFMTPQLLVPYLPLWLMQMGFAPPTPNDGYRTWNVTPKIELLVNVLKLATPPLRVGDRNRDQMTMEFAQHPALPAQLNEQLSQAHAKFARANG